MACASSGGVIGINGIGAFLGENDDRPETLVRHIDHVAELVGPEHVAIALDYVFDERELLEYLASMRETFPDDDAYKAPPKMVPHGALLEITERLCELGYADEAVRNILGGNWRRIAAAVWK